MDVIVHDARMLYKGHGSDSSHLMVSIDATNAFNTCSRSRMLWCLLTKAPALARFINAMYRKIAPPCSFRYHRELLSAARKGDPGGMLFFSLERIDAFFLLNTLHNTEPQALLDKRREAMAEPLAHSSEKGTGRNLRDPNPVYGRFEKLRL